MTQGEHRAREPRDSIDSEAQDRLRTSEERFRAFVTATSDVVYSMSPDWREMRYLVGKDFIADTTAASGAWLSRTGAPSDPRRWHRRVDVLSRSADHEFTRWSY
jgi:hypothetical protein